MNRIYTSSGGVVSWGWDMGFKGGDGLCPICFVGIS